jgi:hypothetical protein
MKCDEAMSRSAGRALGDLEPDDTRGWEEHLASCASCRAGAELDRRTVAALKSDSVEGSEGRRERVVAAMVAARRERGETRIPRRRWIAASVAAALLLALTVPLLMTRGGLTIERLDGTAWIQRADGRFAAKLGDRLRSGDRLETQGVVSLEGAGRVKLVVNRDSELLVIRSDPSPHFRLAKGAVRIDAQETPVDIEDSMDRRASVSGTCEVRSSSVMGFPGRPEAKSELQIRVKKGVVRLGTRTAVEGQTLAVTEEGTVTVEDPAPADPGRKQP